MKETKLSPVRPVFILIALSLFAGTQSTFALGSDHPKQAVSVSSWPKGMSDLVNSPERIHGYFVNAQDVFFFGGDQEHFDQFLRDYAKIDGVLSHKIVIHSGLGRAKSPWQKDEGLRCDWMIDGCPGSWKRAEPTAKGYILEVHLWADGKIKLDKGRIPDGVIVEKAGGTEPDVAVYGSQPHCNHSLALTRSPGPRSTKHGRQSVVKSPLRSSGALRTRETLRTWAGPIPACFSGVKGLAFLSGFL